VNLDGLVRARKEFKEVLLHRGRNGLEVGGV
jgi:hypothetical protein